MTHPRAHSLTLHFPTHTPRTQLALCEVRGVERHDLLKSLLKEMATKLLKEEAAAGLPEHAPLQDVIKQLELQRCVWRAAVVMPLSHSLNERHRSIITSPTSSPPHSTANAAEAARVDHLLVGLAESCKQMRGTLQGESSAPPSIYLCVAGKTNQ